MLKNVFFPEKIIEKLPVWMDKHMHTFKIALSLGLLISGYFFPSAYIRYILHSYAIMLGMQLMTQIAYTKFSFVMLLYACVEEVICKGGSEMFTFFFFNYVGLVSSFHISLLMNRSSFSRLAESMHLSLFQFFWVNIFTHILPLVVASSLALTRNTPKEEFLWSSGIVTSGIHLSWEFLTAKGLNLSEIYIEMETWQWYAMWAFAVSGHIISSFSFFLFYQKN
jgi:hypothetical protein